MNDYGKQNLKRRNNWMEISQETLMINKTRCNQCYKKITKGSKTGFCASCSQKQSQKGIMQFITTLTKKFLYKEYVIKNKGSVKIAEETNHKYDTILKYLRYYNIKIRTRKEAQTGFKASLKSKEKMSKLKRGINHPLYNKHHTKKTKERMSKSHTGLQAGEKNPMFGKVTHGKWGEYKGIKMRSSYEIAFAQWLELSGYKWEYESKTFDLGNTTYTPDFYLPEFDCYIEIKGWWRAKGKTKFDLFIMRHTGINIKVLMQKELQELGVLQ